MKIYHASPSYQQYMQGKNRGLKMDKPGVLSSARKGLSSQIMDSNIPGVIIQPLDEEDPYEMTGKRLAAIRFDRNNRLMSELCNSNYLPDSRSIIQQNRIETLRKQALNLSSHQNKMNNELEQLDETFQKRKQAIEESSSAFISDLKKISDEKPELSEEKYNNILKEHQEYLLKQFDEYQKRQNALKMQLEAEQRETPILYSLTCEKTPPSDNQQSTISPSQQIESKEKTTEKENGSMDLN